MKPRILLATADPSTTGGNPEEDPKTGKPAAAPSSPATVKKTPLKTPREIQLEKDVARLQDRQDQLEGEIGGLKDFLQGLEIGGPKPVPIKKGKLPPTPAPTAGFLNEVERDIWGSPKED